MSRTGRIILIVLATLCLIVAALALSGWAFDDANPAALGFAAAAAWMAAQLP